MDELRHIAQKFIDDRNKKIPFHKDYDLRFSTPPIEFLECWFFYFKIVPKIEIAKEEIKKFAGAPGFTISKKDNKVQTIAWWRLLELEEEQKRKQVLRELLFKIVEENWKPSTIRKLTRLTSRII